MWLKNENQIDMATAISGSGPGYIFTIIDAFEKASQKDWIFKGNFKRVSFINYFRFYLFDGKNK